MTQSNAVPALPSPSGSESGSPSKASSSIATDTTPIIEDQGFADDSDDAMTGAGEVGAIEEDENESVGEIETTSVPTTRTSSRIAAGRPTKASKLSTRGSAAEARGPARLSGNTKKGAAGSGGGQAPRLGGGMDAFGESKLLDKDYLKINFDVFAEIEENAAAENRRRAAPPPPPPTAQLAVGLAAPTATV